jgi:hypothetical protein
VEEDKEGGGEKGGWGGGGGGNTSLVADDFLNDSIAITKTLISLPFLTGKYFFKKWKKRQEKRRRGQISQIDGANE